MPNFYAGLSVPPSPWHVLGSLNGSDSAWILNKPAWASERGRQTIIRTNTGANTNLHNESLILQSGSMSLQGDDYGQWSRQATAASAGSTVGHYVESASAGAFPRPMSRRRGFCTLAEVKVGGTTSRRMVFGVNESTAGSGGLATVTGAVTQSTLSGYYLVLASDATSATTVYYYSALAGTGASAATSTGMTVAANDVLVLALYTLYGASGADKRMGWEVINLTTMTVVRGTFTVSTEGVNEPATISCFPVQGLQTTAASAINNDVKSLLVWEA